MARIHATASFFLATVPVPVRLTTAVPNIQNSALTHDTRIRPSLNSAAAAARINGMCVCVWCARGSGGGTNDDRTRTLGTDGHPPPPNPESAIGDVAMIPRDLDAMRSCGTHVHTHGRRPESGLGCDRPFFWRMRWNLGKLFFFSVGKRKFLESLGCMLFYGVFLVVVETYGR